MKIRRTLLGGLILMAGANAIAQGFPSKPVRMLVPSAPGAGLDIFARIVTQKLAEAWGQAVILDNRPGAGGNIAADIVAKAPPDGYTLLIHTPSFAVNASLQPDLPYDPVRDFSAVTMAFSVSAVMLASPTLPVSSVRDVIALAKAKPDALSYFSNGNGTSTHMNMELFKRLTGTSIQHVPYKVIPQAQTDMMNGTIHLSISPLTGAVPLVRAGKLKAMAVTGSRRSAALPDVPTMKEAGVADYEAIVWYGIFVPVKTSRELVARLNTDTLRAIHSPDAQKRWIELGVDPVGSTPDFMDKYLQTEVLKWRDVVKAAGIKAE